MKYGIKSNISIPGEINTKKELFRVIRELANAGYFFKVTNGFNGNGHAFYMVDVLGKKTDK